ncbi:hypothetical protein ER57_04790 [Smithella sp. SCADC]|nr:hypothetical protein ER57_06740 [Smithella sp. SCADC]KFO68336.1 hypothetical protein ER57_04790 [Smithella sp. SCADC]
MIIKISQSLRSFEMTRLILKSSTRMTAEYIGSDTGVSSEMTELMPFSSDGGCIDPRPCID